MPRMTLTQAAFELGRDGVLNDPSDSDIVLYAAELALGAWPVEGIDRHLAERVIAEYERGEDAAMEAEYETSEVDC